MDNMRSVMQQDRSFRESLAYHRNVTLFQVANAAVNELCAAAGRALAEIVLFKQQYGMATSGSIDSAAGAGRPAAYHNDVPVPFL